MKAESGAAKFLIRRTLVESVSVACYSMITRLGVRLDGEIKGTAGGIGPRCSL